MGKSKKDAVKPYYRARSEGPLKLKKTSTANTEMQIAVIIGAPGLQNSSNHATILPGSAVRTNGSRVTFGSVLSNGTFGAHTPKSGIFSRASLKRLVKFAMQMAKVSSTICPSS
jgi:hypothetical protein